METWKPQWAASLVQYVDTINVNYSSRNLTAKILDNKDTVHEYKMVDYTEESRNPKELIESQQDIPSDTVTPQNWHLL